MTNSFRGIENAYLAPLRGVPVQRRSAAEGSLAGDERSRRVTATLISIRRLESLQPKCGAKFAYRCIVAGVGSLVMLSIIEAKANTPDPDCTVTLAYPRSIAVCPALALNGCVSCAH